MKKILIIDDEEDLKEDLAEILVLASFYPITAGTGREGIEKAIKENPDLILCDILMPGLDGYGVLYILSKHPNTAHIPFIFLSGQSNTCDLRKGLGLGADDYLVKPVQETDLLNAIDLRLAKAERKHKPLNSTGSLSSKILSFINERSGKQVKNQPVHKILKKQIAYAEGQFPDSVFFVLSGKLKEYKLHEYGKPLITNIYRKSDFFGYHAIITDTVYAETVQALEDTELLSVPRNQFLKLLNTDFDFTLQLTTLIIHQEQKGEEQLLKMAYSSLRKKVASGIIEVADLFKSIEQEKADIIDITREDLAHLVGSAPESLIRTLKEFKDEKLIDIRDGSIVLLNEEGLRNLIY
ncbi:MAG TPA: response regulator [Pelobium sp.]|nr:response regulator [Pelobium sp.]